MSADQRSETEAEAASVYEHGGGYTTDAAIALLSFYKLGAGTFIKVEPWPYIPRPHRRRVKRGRGWKRGGVAAKPSMALRQAQVHGWAALLVDGHCCPCQHQVKLLRP